MDNQATIEIYRQGCWQQAAVIKVLNPDEGHLGSSSLEYLIDYAIANIETDQSARVSCRYPIDFSIVDKQTWPAFLLDLLPSGAGRQLLIKRLGIADGYSSDWTLLLNGAASPPGNLRFKEAAEIRDQQKILPTASGELVTRENHPGFDREDILERKEYFIEYAYQNGAIAAGGSDVQGVAPKFLVVQDHGGKWHVEGGIKDSEIADSWLVKFPRGATESDRQILRNECAYMTVAKELGLNVFKPLGWERDCLFIPRFDRVSNETGLLQRRGMESLCSLAGITAYASEYGGAPSHNQLCESIVKYATDPTRELLEYIKRDVTNIVLGNKDNQARNSAVFRHENGLVELTPLFDFAPMYLDKEVIARVSRWAGDAEIAGQPIWRNVIESMPEKIDKGILYKELALFGRKVAQLPNTMKNAGVDKGIIADHLLSITRNAEELQLLVEAQ
jgi:serine/threonine-protein kinase HipA